MDESNVLATSQPGESLVLRELVIAQPFKESLWRTLTWVGGLMRLNGPKSSKVDSSPSDARCSWTGLDLLASGSLTGLTRSGLVFANVLHHPPGLKG